MIIGIDASRYSNTPTPTGVEVYSQEIIPRLIKLIEKNGHSPKLYTPKKIEDFPEEIQCILPFPRFWSMIRLSAHFTRKDLHPDVFFVPSHILPPVCPENTIVTIHDVAYRHYPEAYTSTQKRILEYGVKNAKNKKATIITISEASKQDLTNLYQIPEEHITLIPLGFSPKNTPYSEEEKVELLQRLNVSENKFIFSLGRIETKKNTQSLCNAFLQSHIPSSTQLVCAGTLGPGGESIKTAYSSHDRIHFPGFITEKEASILYDSCIFFAIPSLYEGFCMPILEAYSHQKAVLTSNSSSMPEVAGPGALLCDPNNISDLAEKISELTKNKHLRTSLAEKGQSYAKNYSWDACAISIYNTLIEKTK